MKRTILITELLAISFILPLILSLLPIRGVIFIGLWLIMLYAVAVMARTNRTPLKLPIFNWHMVRNKQAIGPVLKRFLISAALLTAAVLFLYPQGFLSFPQERPRLWLAVMCLYPILSVIPQEVVFRSFFFQRYASLFTSPNAMIIASALSFGIAHVLLKNWVAVALSTLGGFLFAHTYQKHKSLGLVWLEHALYGCFVFTIGLGFFFYSGAPHKW